MVTFNSVDEFYLALSLLSPGVIILYIRCQFLTGRLPTGSNALLYYLTVSFVYYAITYPFFDIEVLRYNAKEGYIIIWFLFVLVGPAFLGLFLGYDNKKGIIRKIIKIINLNPVHSMPTAWDWKFSNDDCANSWILVTLKDGTRFAGFLGEDSFVSSDPAERDIFIQWVYDLDDENKWVSRENSSVLISGNEIRTVEFWPYSESGEME